MDLSRFPSRKTSHTYASLFMRILYIASILSCSVRNFNTFLNLRLYKFSYLTFRMKNIVSARTFKCIHSFLFMLPIQSTQYIHRARIIITLYFQIILLSFTTHDPISQSSVFQHSTFTNKEYE